MNLNTSYAFSMHSMLDVTIYRFFGVPDRFAAHLDEKSKVTAKGFGGRVTVGSILQGSMSSGLTMAYHVLLNVSW